MRELKEILYANAGLENLTENLVFQELYDLSQKLNKQKNSEFCTCNICLADVAAIVLNDMKHYYYSNFLDKGKSEEYYLKNRTEVQQKILKALDLVKKNPHHQK